MTVVDWHAFNTIISTRNGVWTLVALTMLGLWRGWTGLPAVMAQWTARRQALAAEKAADWQRLRDEVVRYIGRLEAVEAECAEFRRAVQDCEEREIEWRRRAIEAEAALQGQGVVRQSAAMAAAEVRLAAKDAERKGEGK